MVFDWSRYRSSFDGLTQGIRHTGQVIAEEVPVAIKRHCRRGVSQEPLHDLDVSARADVKGTCGLKV